jgi:hypothetical protein
MAMANLSQIGFPLILKQFIRWLVDEEDTSYWGYFWIVMLCLIMLLKVVLLRAGVFGMHKSRNTLGNRFAVRLDFSGIFHGTFSLFLEIFGDFLTQI